MLFIAGALVIGLFATVIPLAVWDVDALHPAFVIWLLVPFFVLGVFGRRGNVLIKGLGLAALAVGMFVLEVDILRDESSTSALGLLFLPVYALVGVVALLTINAIVRRSTTR
jgi:hypothetical protein